MAKGGYTLLEADGTKMPFHKRRGAFGAQAMITIPITGLMFPRIYILHIHIFVSSRFNKASLFITCNANWLVNYL